MKGFAQRSTVDQALAWIDQHATQLGCQQVDLLSAVSRVLAEDVVSQFNVPSFRRAMMDGYAVQAADVLGATSYNRINLELIGEVLPGQQSEGVVQSGQAVRIMTGSVLPAGADAVPRESETGRIPYV